MKKAIGILAVAVLTAGSATLALAGSDPGTGVYNSKHDMNARVGARQDAMGRVCVYCHTPHNITQDEAATGTDNFPLWNHTLPETTAWQSYKWAAPANAGFVQDSLAGPSRLCMSCHDGVIAIDQHGPALFQEGISPAYDNANANIAQGTKDLTNDHPIGFSWDTALAARNDTSNGGQSGFSREIAMKTDRFVTNIQPSATAGVYDTLTRGGKRTIGDVLFNGDIMTCASCHDVHNKDNVAPSVNNNGVQNNYFLWADQNNSLLCISCHYK